MKTDLLDYVPSFPLFKMLFDSYIVNSLTIKIGVKNSAHLCCSWQNFKWSQILLSSWNQTRSYRLDVFLLNPISSFGIHNLVCERGILFCDYPNLKFTFFFFQMFLFEWMKHIQHLADIMIIKITPARLPGTKNMWFTNYERRKKAIMTN